jgi:hypothetical protein
MARLARVKLGENYAKATGSSKKADFYFPGLTLFFFFSFLCIVGIDKYPEILE